MKHLFIRFQLVLVSILLLVTFGMMMGIVLKNNYRWDATSEKVYSVSDQTVKLLEKLQGSPVEVLAFYPHDDPARANFEVFMRQCQLHHRQFRYNFFDPDRVPSLAKKYDIKTYYTVVIQYQGRTESVVSPNEEGFTNTLLRLSNPKRFNLCFATGHDEMSVQEQGRNGLSSFVTTLEAMNYEIHEIILLRDKVPALCNLVIVPGPHQDFDQLEFKYIKKAFQSGRGILFLIDPMDPGTGKGFRDFMAEFGILMGEDVIVDKMSRLVGGDFLVPLVNQYVTEHPITAHFEKPTFFPVSRSLQPSDQAKKGYEVVPIALTGNASWAEANLQSLEQGDAAFEPVGGDLQGPLPVVVAVERKLTPKPAKDVQGKPEDSKPALLNRMVVAGDSDFLSNAYVNLSGNNDFALNIIQWLSQDDRFISIHVREPEFKPLFLTSRQRTAILFVCVMLLPLAALLIGGALVWRRKRS